MSGDFLQKYEICGQKQQNFYINSFEQIGMADPFPDDFDGFPRPDFEPTTLILPETIEKSVYYDSKQGRKRCSP